MSPGLALRLRFRMWLPQVYQNRRKPGSRYVMYTHARTLKQWLMLDNSYSARCSFEFLMALESRVESESSNVIGKVPGSNQAGFDH